MIDTIMNILKLLLAVAPFVLFCLLGAKNNLPKPERSRQLLMPVVALVYALAAMLLVDWVNDWLFKLITNIPQWLIKLAGFSWMPAAVSGVLVKISVALRDFLRKVNLEFWIFFIANVAILLVYLLVKRIAISMMRRLVKTDSTLHQRISGVFYEYFAQKDAWCLREGYAQVRSLMKVFFYGAVTISSILMVLSGRLYEKELLSGVFYPVFSVIVLGELYYYLDGATRREYSNDILGEDENAYKTVNYSLIRKFLRSLFGDKLLSERTGVNNSLAYPVTTEELISRLEKSEDQSISNFAIYMDALHRTGFSIDHNYLQSSLELMEGKSILFNNPFYQDLIPYAFYPMNRILMRHKKVLVVLGRHDTQDDAIHWLEKGIEAVTNLPFLWKIGILGRQEQELDIGILTRSDVLDMELQDANSKFLADVGFCVVLEPSKLVSTAQIGLNLIAKRCNHDGEREVVYCLCDKNCDGLVDAMSHVLMANLTEVSATHKHTGTSSYMCWDADSEYLHHRLLPNISRYLGMGTELSFAALKNQVATTRWYGGEAFPVTDIRWIDKQYYYDLTKYANLPTSQEEMDEHFLTSANLWSAEVEKNNYITVEDEACNMFEILREFSTRATEQGFINVISSDYLLKDYMADNATIFETDPKAIPYIAADFVRSNRNTILRMILMMSIRPVCASVLEKEFSMLGIPVFDLHQQLWYELYRCYSPVQTMQELPEDQKEAARTVFDRKLELQGHVWDRDLIRCREKFNLDAGVVELVYSIEDEAFLQLCVTALKSAGYVAEDEKGQRYYLGAELHGQIYQKYLPGQFFTFGGKYYQMQYLTADGQVLVRRAADHINGRTAYRQVRRYSISATDSSERIGAQKIVAGMKVERLFADFQVETPGYYAMEKYQDLANASYVDFRHSKKGIPVRQYRNKEILRLELPDVTDNVRYTLAVAFNEVFRTLFAENQAYICAVTDDSFLETDNQKPLTMTVEASGDNAIYIIEDSQLDLGLIEAVERNLQRIFGIVHDYLDWHLTKLKHSKTPPRPAQPELVFTDPSEDPAPTGKKQAKGKKKGCLGGIFRAIGGFFGFIFGLIGGAFAKLWQFLKGLFKKKPKETPAGETPTEETPAEETPAEEPSEDPSPNETPAEATAEDAAEDHARKAGEPGQGLSVAQLAKQGFGAKRKPYHERYFLLYGYEEMPACLAPEETLEYLTQTGHGNNPLRQARAGKDIAALVEATFQPGKPDARYCDFCGAEIYGVEYETLADGRDRCLTCSRTAIKTGEEFTKIFEDVKRNLEAFFGIQINTGIRVEMVNSRKLHKRLGEHFTPTPGYDGRVLGVAIKHRNGHYTLMVENGSPRMASMLTMAHELTHIWQYLNWDAKAIRRKYGKRMELEVYEGMAKWVEVQYAYLINEPATAKRQEILTAYRDDEYGRGFLRYRAQYPFSLGTVIVHPTPFMNPQEPLAPEFCGNITVKLPTDGLIPPPPEDPRDPQPPAPEGPAKPKGPSSDPQPQTPAAPAGAGEDPADSRKDPLDGPADRTPGNVSYYAYQLLDEQERILYAAMLNAIRNFETELDPMPVTLSYEQCQKITVYIQRDHPDIFWFQNGTTYHYDTDTMVVLKLTFAYRMTRQEAGKRQRQIDAATTPILSGITSSMSNIAAVLHVYESLIRMSDYDSLKLDEQHAEGIDRTEPDDIRSIYGVFVNRRAVCVGYAKATQYLLNKLGIECTVVTSEDHAWNLLRLEGAYYHLDTTWGDSSDTKPEKDFGDDISYDFFCMSDTDLRRLESHELEAVMPVPACTATACNYYRRFGLYFTKADPAALRGAILRHMQRGHLQVYLKFSDSATLMSAKQYLVDNGGVEQVAREYELAGGGKLTDKRYATHEERLWLRLTFKK